MTKNRGVFCARWRARPQTHGELNIAALGFPSRCLTLAALGTLSFRDARQPIFRRMRAAIAALPFERPKLAVTAVLDGGSFAEQLDRAIEATQQAKQVHEGDRGEGVAARRSSPDAG